MHSQPAIQCGKQCVSARGRVCVCVRIYVYSRVCAMYVPISFTFNKLGSTERPSNEKFEYTPMIIDLKIKTAENGKARERESDNKCVRFL